MTQYTHQKCPYCSHNGCYSYNTELNVYNCYSCGASGRLNKTHETYEEEEGLSLEPYIPETYRGISKRVMEDCGVYFTKQGDKETVHYTYPEATKHRELPKNIKCSGKLNSFWGQDDYNGGGKYITIVEGEEDRMSVIQMMGNYPCVSVPGATPSKEFWQNAQSYLQGFEKIILSVDNDDAGNKLAEKFYRIFPGKVYRVNHTKHKDANEFLQAKAQAEYKTAWWNAPKIKPEYFISSPDQWEKILTEENPYEYFPTPIDALNDKIRGFTKGGVTVVKALPGTGKTTIFRFFQHHLIKNLKCPIAILHMEEQDSTTARGLVTYDLGVNVSTKEDAKRNGVTEEKVVETIRHLSHDEKFVTFSVDPNNPIDDTLEKVRLARQIYGVEFVFLDHLQRLAYLSGTDGATSELTRLAVQLVDMTRKDNFGVIAISHVNSDGNTKYAMSVEEEAIMVMELSRDKKAEDPEERDTTYIDVTKNRPFASLGSAGQLTYDHETTMVSEKMGPSEPVFDHTDTSKDIPF